MNAPPTNAAIQSLLVSVERLLRTFSHLILWVEKAMVDAEAQRWSQQR